MPPPRKRPTAEIEAALDETVVDSDGPRRVKGCLYGEFGTWKTSTAAQTAKEHGTLIATDNGWQALRNLPSLDGSGTLLDNYEIMLYSGLSQLTAIAERVIDGKFRDSDTLILDTTSQMQEEYLDFILDKVDYGGKYREKANVEAAYKEEIGKVEVPVPVDYHLVRNKMRPVLKSLIKADIDVWFLCHVRDPSLMDKSSMKRPSLTEAVYKVVARECNLVGYMTKSNREAEAKVTFAPSPLVSAKSQIGPLRDKELTASEFVTIIKDWKS